MYEFIILSLLMRFPLHGYLIAQIANDIIGPWAKISNGTLCPLLTRLEQTGLTQPDNHAAASVQPLPDRPARRHFAYRPHEAFALLLPSKMA